MQCMGRCELHAVVAAKGKHVGKATRRFHQGLADFNNGEALPGLNQVLPSLFEIVVIDRIVPPQASQGSHGFCPADPANPDGINSGADLPQLI